jgi:8-amino-7-oxononanoate synthase
MDFTALEGALNANVTCNGESYLYFGGTAYLGIPRNQEFQAHYLTGIQKFGLSNGTSRSNNVQLGIYNEAEKYAANKFGTAAALITSSGFLAAQIAVKALTNKENVRYAPATHPALWMTDLPQPTGTFTDWAAQIVAEINASDQIEWVLIANSMNNLVPEIYDFSFLTAIAPNKRITLLIDDSHGIGINHNGATALAAVPVCENVAVLIVASMAKALGIDAGIVLGPTQLIDSLKENNVFLGASPPAAAGLYAFMQSEEIYSTALKKLQTNILLLANALREKGDWHFIPNFPVFFSKNADISNSLLKHQVLVSSFPYPDRNGPTVNRIVLSSWHTEYDIKKLITIL